MAARLITCQVQNFKRVHSTEVEKVCQALSSIKLSSRNYIKSGRSSPLVKDVNKSLEDSRRKSRRTSSDVNKSFNTSDLGIGKSKCIGSSFPSGTFDVVDSGNAASRQSEGYTSMHSYSHSIMISGLSSNQTVHASPVDGIQNTFSDGIADDDIVENLDVDQIIMEHYQWADTPQPSISKLLPFTPTVIKDNDARPESTCLPLELCVNCSHGLKLGLCSTAANHLQDMKGMLISISNDLLDNVSDLNPDQIEKLCQDRLQLNKQIKQLQKHLCVTSLDEERQNSHFSASTAAPRIFNYDNPPTAAFRIDPKRLESQFHIHNEPDGFDRLNSSFGVPPTPIEREPYIRKYVDV